MIALHTIFSDTIVLSGNAFNWHFTVTMTQLIYWVIAAIIGIIAEAIVGWRAPLGILGAFLAALLGIWLMTGVLLVSIPGDITLYGVPLLKVLIGAIVMVIIWHAITYRAWKKPRQSVA